MCIQCELLAALKQRFKYSRTIMAASTGSGRGGVARQLAVHLDVYLLVQEVHTTAEALPLGVAAIYTIPDPCFLLSSALLLLTWRIRNLRQAARNCIFNRFYIGFYSCSYIARVRERRGYICEFFGKAKIFSGKSVSFLLLKSARIFAAYFWPSWPANVPLAWLAFHFR